MATLNVGTLEAILRLNDQMTPALKKQLAAMKDAVIAFGALGSAIAVANKADAITAAVAAVIASAPAHGASSAGGSKRGLGVMTVAAMSR